MHVHVCVCCTSIRVHMSLVQIFGNCTEDLNFSVHAWLFLDAYSELCFLHCNSLEELLFSRSLLTSVFLLVNSREKLVF